MIDILTYFALCFSILGLIIVLIINRKIYKMMMAEIISNKTPEVYKVKKTKTEERFQSLIGLKIKKIIIARGEDDTIFLENGIKLTVGRVTEKGEIEDCPKDDKHYTFVFNFPKEIKTDKEGG